MGNYQTAVQNLTKKGAAANPNGRPKREWTVAGLIEQAMEEVAETGIPYKKAVYTKLVRMARDGDIQAIKEVSNRLDGMPTQKQEVGGIDGEPIKYLFEIVQDNKLLDANQEDTDTNQELLSPESDIPQS